MFYNPISSFTNAHAWNSAPLGHSITSEHLPWPDCFVEHVKKPLFISQVNLVNNMLTYLNEKPHIWKPVLITHSIICIAEICKTTMEHTGEYNLEMRFSYMHQIQK